MMSQARPRRVSSIWRVYCSVAIGCADVVRVQRLCVAAYCLVFDLLRCFFFNDTATTEIYTLSLHDALPICGDHDMDEEEEDYCMSTNLSCPKCGSFYMVYLPKDKEENT